MALTAVALMVLPAGSPLPVAADDLNQRKHAVERRIQGAGRELDQSSVDLARATRALTATESRLRAAKAAVSITRAQFVAARALDDQAQASLGTAEEALSAATSDVDDVGVRIRAQEVALRQIVLQTYQDGPPSLMALSMVLKSREPADLSGQLNSVQNVVSKESATLDRLAATRAVFLVKQREVVVAKATMTRQRLAAARMLLRRRSLEAQARSTERDIHGLVVDRETQRRRAVRARADDRQQLRDLQRERDRVSALLQRHAAEARRRAAAEAASRLKPGLRRPTPTAGRSLSWPVNGWISSPFGMRFHPVYKRLSLHDGLDIASPCGTPVRAAADGRVLAVY